MRRERPEPRSGLPAPYVAPWRRLAADIRDVVASLGLWLRELWRRNGEGDLPQPGFWPSSWAPFFWPLVLALTLAGIGLIPTSLASFRQSRLAPGSGGPGLQGKAARSSGGGAGNAAADATPREAEPPSPSETATAATDQVEGEGRGGDRSNGKGEGEGESKRPGNGEAEGKRLGRGEPPAAAAPDPEPAATGTVAAVGAAEQSAAGSPAGSADGSTAELPDPLLAELLGEEPPPWALAVEATPSRGLMRLRLDAGFGERPKIGRAHV